jgi:TPR repeat protein
MNFPGTENSVPAFKHIAFTLTLLVTPLSALADAGEDYQTGLAAYRVGDIAGSMAPLKRAADAGHAGGQALYGTILDSAESDEEAVTYLLKAVEQGNADGQYALAKMYLTHEAKAPDEGAPGRLMRAAAAGGHERATISLALAYLSKDARLGAATPTEETGPLLIKAAEIGDVTAMEALSNAYRNGEFGLAPDAAKADHWKAKLATIRGEAPKAGGKKK